MNKDSKNMEFNNKDKSLHIFDFINMFLTDEKIRNESWLEGADNIEDRNGFIHGANFVLDIIKKYQNEHIQHVVQWVSINEGLPPKNTVVLAYYPEGNENGRKVDTTTYYGGKLTDTGSSVAYCFEATHWAMLPEPPYI